MSAANGGAPEPTDATPWRVILPLARGGMGRVDLAVRAVGEFRHLYAIKRMHAALAAEDDSMARMFLQEARVAGLIRHANVVSVVDVGEDREGPFLVMPYVEGCSLSRLLHAQARRGGLLPMQVVLRIGRDVAEGLSAAHELSDDSGGALPVVHRDVSPQNILIGFDGVCRLTDFGIAKIHGSAYRTGTGILKGKVPYMSPEQLRFETPDARSDLFSLGVVLFEALTGERLYRSGAIEETAARILHEPAPDLGQSRDDAPDELVELLLRMLAKDPALRPQTAREVARTLEAIAVDVASMEGPLATADCVAELMSDERAAMATRLSEALTATDSALEIDTVPTVSAPSPKTRGTRALVLPLLAVVMGLAGLVTGLLVWPPADPQEVPRAAIEPAAAPADEVTLVGDGSAEAEALDGPRHPVDEASTEEPSEAPPPDETNGVEAPSPERSPTVRPARRGRGRAQPSSRSPEPWRQF